MSYNLSVNDLQDLAVRCTAQFTNHQIPLNESLAKEAADLSLNSEQVKRACEATNTLCYLGTLTKVAGERTTEFPLADYNEVMKIASTPKNLSTPENKWSAGPGAASVPDLDFDKQASIFPTLSEKESQIYLEKYAAINKRALEDAQEESYSVAARLVKQASQFKKDPQALEKLSAVAEEAAFQKMSVLVFGEVKDRRELPSSMFKQANLKEVTDLTVLYKEAEALVADIARRSSLQKQAGLVSGAFGLLGAGIGHSARLLTKGVTGLAGGLAKGVGKAAYNGAAVPASKAFAETGVGKALQAKTLTEMPKAKWMGAAMVAGGAGMDASMYTPKQNPVTGSGGDVWNKLQGS